MSLSSLKQECELRKQRGKLSLIHSNCYHAAFFIVHRSVNTLNKPRWCTPSLDGINVQNSCPALERTGIEIENLIEIGVFFNS